MVWLLIAVVALFVIAPVFWIMPTPIQRRQERMRARALALGLEVISCELPQTRRQRVRGEPRRRGMLYRAPLIIDSRERDAEIPIAPLRWLREPGGDWEIDETVAEPETTDTRVPPAELPATAFGYEIGRGGAGVYWLEGRDEPAVERLAAILTSERDKLIERLGLRAG
jgi:hypothetical protein